MRQRGLYWVSAWLLLWGCMLSEALADEALPSEDVAVVNATTVPKAATATECQVGLFVHQVYGLNHDDSAVGLDFWVWMHCPIHTPHTVKDLDFVNALEEPNSQVITESLGDSLYSTRRVQLEFQHRWNLTYFPFDTQTLEIIVEHNMLESDQLSLTPDASNSGIDTMRNLHHWVLQDHSFESQLYGYTTNYGMTTEPNQSDFSRLVFSFDIERRNSSMIWRLTFGMFCAVAVAMMTFFMNPSVPTLHSGQMGAVVGALFAVVVNYRSVETYLEHNYSMAFLDLLHIYSMLFVVLIGAFMLRKRYLMNHTDQEVVQPDLRMFAYCSSAFLLGCVLCFAWVLL
jgi:hypothetical protein